MNGRRYVPSGQHTVPDGRAGTLRSTVLGWQAGSVDRVLDGDDPVVMTTPEPKVDEGREAIEKLPAHVELAT